MGKDIVLAFANCAKDDRYRSGHHIFQPLD